MMGEHGFGCVCLDCSGNKIADGAYEFGARARSGLESHEPDPACACPRCDGMRSVAGFPQPAKGFRFTPGSLAALAEEQAKAANPPIRFDPVTGERVVLSESSGVMQAMSAADRRLRWADRFFGRRLGLGDPNDPQELHGPSAYGTQPGDESEAEPLRDPVTPMDEAIGAALRVECLKVFGSTWSNDIAWRFAQVAQRAMAAAAPQPYRDALALPSRECCGGLAGCSDQGCDLWRATKERERANMTPLGFDWRGVAEKQADGIAALEAEVVALRTRAETAERALGIVAAEQGNHDWKGPTRDVLDKDGEPTGRREAVSDPVAEQVHRVVGDVLAGKVLPAQREQLGDALGKAPKHKANPGTSTDAPMPGKALRLARADVGLKLP